MNRCDSTDSTEILHNLDDTATLDAIAAVLIGCESPAETLKEVVKLVRASRRTIAAPAEGDNASTDLDEEVLRRIRSGALPSEDVEILPCQPTRGSDDGWWVEVRVWVPDRTAD